MELDIFSFDCAEALLQFVGRSDVLEDFYSKSAQFDLSLAEYVYHFRYNEFKQWYSEKYL